jgi:prepilin-type N-terminal cleavage/methylation domain-containing protein
MSARWSRMRREDVNAGFTLVELLVAIVLMGILGSVFLAVTLSAKNSTNQTTSQQDLNEEARQAINRMAREIRQATSIISVLNPDGTSYDPNKITAITFTADFNGDGCIDNATPAPVPQPAPTCAAVPSADPNNPETLTYCWDPSASVRQLYIVPGQLNSSTSCQGSGAMPILAGQVTSFMLKYQSNLYLYDGNGDGVTSWSELDQADPPIGDPGTPGAGVLDSNELRNIDSVVIDLSVAAGGTHHTQNYETQVDLRNLS